MTLLFVPGFMADQSLWDDVVSMLPPQDDVAFVELNQGDSIEHMARLALENAPADFDLIGFSMGGYVARAMARLAPARVKSLLLVATSGRADTVDQKGSKAAAAAQLASAISFRGLSRASILASIHPNRLNDEALIERVRAMGVRLGKEVFLRQSLLPRVSDLETLSQIQCPTCVIAAKEDRLRSLDEALEIKEGIPNAQLVVIEGAGHMVPIEDPGAVLQALRVLQRRRL